jgi:hypothetical protein
MIGVWRSGLNDARFKAMIELGKAASEMKQGPIPSLSVVVQLPGATDPRSRELGKDLTREMAPYSLCGAQVLEGSGLWMATVRLLVTTVQLAAGNKIPSRVFDRVDDAVLWLSTQDRVNVDGVIAAVKDMRAQLEKQPLK